MGSDMSLSVNVQLCSQRVGGLAWMVRRWIVKEWAACIGLDQSRYGTHSLRRTKATLIYKRTKNIRAIQLLLGHTARGNRRRESVPSNQHRLLGEDTRHRALR
jgi:integrase